MNFNRFFGSVNIPCFGGRFSPVQAGRDGDLPARRTD